MDWIWNVLYEPWNVYVIQRYGRHPVRCWRDVVPISAAHSVSRWRTSRESSGTSTHLDSQRTTTSAWPLWQSTSCVTEVSWGQRWSLTPYTTPTQVRQTLHVSTLYSELEDGRALEGVHNSRRPLDRLQYVFALYDPVKLQSTLDTGIVHRESSPIN